MKSSEELYNTDQTPVQRQLTLVEKTLRQLLEHPDLGEIFAYLDTVSSVTVGRCAKRRNGAQTVDILFSISYARKPSYSQFVDRINLVIAALRDNTPAISCCTDTRTRHLHLMIDDCPAPNLPPLNGYDFVTPTVILIEGTNYLMIELAFPQTYLRAVS